MLFLYLQLFTILCGSFEIDSSNWYTGNLETSGLPKASPIVMIGENNVCTKSASLTPYVNFTLEAKKQAFYFFTALFDISFRDSAQIQVYNGVFSEENPCNNILYVDNGKNLVPHIYFVLFLDVGKYNVVVTGKQSFDLGLFSVHVDTTMYEMFIQNDTSPMWTPPYGGWAPYRFSFSECFEPQPAPFSHVTWTQQEAGIFFLVFRKLKRRYHSNYAEAKETSLSFFGSSVISYSDLQIKSKIGEGEFGSVYEGVYFETAVAIKQIKDGKNFNAEDFLVEAELMKKLTAHPNIVLFRGVSLPPDPICIVTDFCPGGSLRDFLFANRGKVSEDRMFQIAQDIAKGMLWLHVGIPNEAIIHRDLAARNILLKGDGSCAVSDFGLARSAPTNESGHSTYSLVGPIKWMAPESIMNRMYGIKTDSFSFGVVLYEITTQSDPWDGIPLTTVSVHVATGKRMDIPPHVNNEFKEIMNKCWAQDPEVRPDFKEILKMLGHSNSSHLVRTSCEDPPNYVLSTFDEEQTL